MNKPAQPIPKLHLIDSELGGKGKSLFTRSLAHYCQTQDYAIQLIDADQSNYNVQRFYPDAAQLAFSELEYRGTDRIWTALEQGLSVVMNLPAGAHRYVKAWLERDGILDLKLAPSKVSNKLFEGDLEQGHAVTLVKWFLCDATQESLDKCQESVAAYKAKGEQVIHVLVKNQGLSLQTQWEIVEDNAEFKALLQSPQMQQMSLPKFPHYERDRLTELGWNFAQAIQKSDAFFVLERQRIVNFLKQFSAQVDATKLWDGAPKRSELQSLHSAAKPAKGFQPTTAS
jgi:hypothetical protein